MGEVAIDSLAIEIEANAKNANSAINRLSKQLGKLTDALDKVDIGKMQSISSAMSTISDALKSMPNAKNLNSVVKSLNSISISEKAVKGIEDAKKASDGLKKATDGVKDIKISADESKAVKGIEGVKKAAEGLKNIKAKVRFEDFDAAAKKVQGMFKDSGMDIKIPDGLEQLEKKIKSFENTQDKLLEKQKKMREVGANVNGEKFIGLQRDIMYVNNALDVMKGKLKEIKTDGIDQSLQTVSLGNSQESLRTLDSYKEELKSVIATLKVLRETYKGIKNVPKGTIDIQIENIKVALDELTKDFPNATKEIAAFQNQLKKLEEIVPKLKDTSISQNVGTNAQDNAIDKTAEKLERLRNKYKNFGKDFKFGESFKNVDVVIEGLQTDLARLAEKEKKMLSAGKIDTSEFEKLQKEIAETGNKLNSLKDLKIRTEEFNQAMHRIEFPEVREDNPEKLRRLLKKLQGDADKFRTSLRNGLSEGKIVENIDDNGFRTLTRNIAYTERGIEAVNERLREVSHVSGWQRVTQVASAMGRAFTSMRSGISKVVSTIGKIGRAFSGLYSVVKKVSSAIGKMFQGMIQLASKAVGAIAGVARSISSFASKIRGADGGIKGMSLSLGNFVKAAIGLKSLHSIVNFGKSAIELGSDITEVENVVDTAFGRMADKAYEFASVAKENFGLSELAAKQYAGTMMAMMRSSGIVQDEAANMSVSLAALSGDLASFYNVDTDEAFKKLRSGIAGQTMPLRAFGINMNIANLEAYAMSKGINKAYKEMSLSEQTMLRYNYILAKTSYVQGDYSKTLGTYANQFRLLRLNIQSISAVIGQGLIAALLPAIKYLNQFMDKLMQAANKFRDFMYVLTGKKADSNARGVVQDISDIVDYDTDLSGIGDSAEDIGDGMEDASSGVKKLQKSLNVLSFDQLNQLSSNLDKISKDSKKDLGVDKLGGMDDMYDDIYDKKQEEPINEWAKRIKDAFLNHDWEGLGKVVAELLNNGLERVYKVIKKITPKIEGALQDFAKVFNSFVKWLDWDLLGRTVGAGINLVVKAFNSMFGAGGIDIVNLGRKLSVGVRGLLDEVNWVELGNAIGNGFMIAWGIAYGIIEDMWRIDPKTLLTGWAELGIALAEAVRGIFESVDFGLIGEAISRLFNGIVETIHSFRDKMLSDDTWTLIAENIRNGLTNLFKVDLAGMAVQLGGLALDILNMLNNAVENVPFFEFGHKIAEALCSIQWLQIFDQVFAFISATFGEAMLGFLNYLTTNAEQLGQSFANLINNLFDKIKQITEGIPWNDIGTGIATFLNKAIEGINIEQAAMSIGNLITSILGTMLQVAQDTNWSDLGFKIGNALASIPWGTMFQQAFDIITTTIGGLLSGLAESLIPKFPELGTSLANGFNYAFQRLNEFASSVSWTDVGSYIATGLNNMIRGIDWEAAGETFGNLVKGVVDTIFTVAQETDWVAFGKGIGDFLDGIPWLSILGEVALGIADIIGGVIAGLFETTSGKVLLGIGLVILRAKGAGLAESAFEIVGKFAQNFKSLPEGVTSVIPTLKEKIGEIAGEGGLLSKISSKAGDVATKAGSFLGKIGSVVFSPQGLLIVGIAIGVALIIAHWDDIKKAAGAVKDWCSEKFKALKESISESMKEVAKNTKEKWNEAKGNFEEFDNFLKNVFSRDWTDSFGFLGNTFNSFGVNVSNIWESIKRIFSGVIDFVAGVFTGDWERAWQGVKNIFGGIWDGFAAVVKAPINTVIGILNALNDAVAFTVNSVGKMLNGLNIKIPDWVPGLGGKELRFNIPTWTPGKFPYLAKGGVLKRGQLGILEGSGAEAVVPLEHNRRWIGKVSEEMARSNRSNLGEGASVDIVNKIVEGIVTAMIANQGNQPPINVNCYATLRTEDNEVLARAVTKGQQSLDYRTNPTPQYG